MHGLSTFVPDGQVRDSVRITSTDSFGLGTIWALDAHRVPYGCRYVAEDATTTATETNLRFTWCLGCILESGSGCRMAIR